MKKRDLILNGLAAVGLAAGAANAEAQTNKALELVPSNTMITVNEDQPDSIGHWTTWEVNKGDRTIVNATVKTLLNDERRTDPGSMLYDVKYQTGLTGFGMPKEVGSQGDFAGFWATAEGTFNTGLPIKGNGVAAKLAKTVFPDDIRFGVMKVGDEVNLGMRAGFNTGALKMIADNKAGKFARFVTPERAWTMWDKNGNHIYTEGVFIEGPELLKKAVKDKGGNKLRNVLAAGLPDLAIVSAVGPKGHVRPAFALGYNIRNHLNGK